MEQGDISFSRSLSARKGDFMLGFFFFAIYIFIYGMMVFRFGLHQDEVLDIDGGATSTYVAAGRWGMALYRFLMGKGMAPWADGVTAGVFLCVALVLQTRLFELKGGVQFFYGIFALGTIQFSYVLVYSFQSAPVALGLLCATASARLLKSGDTGWRGYAAVVGILVYAVACYQVCAIYFLVLLAGLYFRGQFAVRRVMQAVICLAGACCIWYVVRAVSMIWVSDEVKQYVLDYQKGMTQWHTLPGKGVEVWVLFVLHYLKIMHLHALGCQYAGQWVYASAMFPLIFLVVKEFRTGRRRIELLLRVGLLYFIWVAPFTMTLLMGTVQGARTNLAEPLSCAFLWGTFLAETRVSPLRMVLIVILSCVVLLRGSVAVSRFAFFEKLDFERWMTSLRTIELQAAELANNAGLTDYRVYCCNLNKRPSKKIGWFLPIERGIDPVKAGTLMWYAEPWKLEHLNLPERGLFPKKIRQAPSWPNPDSFVIFGGNIYVRVDNL